MSRPAAGGGRWVEVDPDRLERWLAGFAARHGDLRWQVAGGGDRVEVVAADGALAQVHVPFSSLRTNTGEPYGGLLAHALRERRLGLLLVRRGGHAVGIAQGARLVASKVGSSYVQGRSAAGGWSQQRFARRRSDQARRAATTAADAAARVLLPEAGALDSVVTGGDRAMVAAVLADPRLAGLAPLVADRVLDVPEPRRAVLEAAVGAARAVLVRVTDPEPG